MSGCQSIPTSGYSPPASQSLSLHRPKTVLPYPCRSMAKAEGIGSVSLTTSFTTPGSYEAIAIATSTDGFTASDTLRLLRLAPTTIAAYPGDEVKQGAVYSSGSGSATFAIAAPGKSSVLLVGSWNGFALDPAQQMSKATATVELPADTSFIKNAWSLHQPYFWTTVEGLEPGMDYTYYYLIDGTTAVCDPYAHLVLDPSSDRYISPDVFPDMPEYPSGRCPTARFSQFSQPMPLL